MISTRISLLILGSSLALAGCFKNNVGAGDGVSGLSTVDIATPTKEDLGRAYGTDCANVKLSADTLAKVASKTGCDALIALTNDYRLTIEGGSCADGSKGTNIAATTGQLNSQNIQTSLKSNCDYSVKLELGLAGAYYFDNTKTWRDNLKRSDISGPTAQLTIRLSPTGAGEQAGLPPGPEVETTGFTNLKIQVNFGSGATDAGSQNPNPGPNAPGGGPIEFVAPQNWNGLSFQGDSLFSLSKQP